jgi:hypothetical protein
MQRVFRFSIRRQFASFTVVFPVLGLLAGPTFAKPRPPQPPIPEPLLARWSFDDTNAFPVAASSAPGNVPVLIESWSGYALRIGPASCPVMTPITTPEGQSLLHERGGSFRLWFRPLWSSVGAGGNGPGQWATLWEIARIRGGHDGFWLAVLVQPDGRSVSLRARSEGEVQTCVETPVRWVSNQWHEIVVTFPGETTALYVDGAEAGRSERCFVWPNPDGWRDLSFCIGGSLDGRSVAAGDFEEVSTLSEALTPDYINWNYQRLARVAALGPVTEEELLARKEAALAAKMGLQSLTADGPPAPPGGGSSGGGGESPPPPPPPPGLKLTVPVVAGNSLAISLREADTNDAYDIFHKTALSAGNNWTLVAAGGVGQTNFAVALPSTNAAFYRAATALDSDGDGLSDAFELSVTGTATNLFDSDSDGISDALEDSNGNGIPNFAEAARNVAVCVYASQRTATEGGAGGQFTILLPEPAPPGGVRVDYMLGGGALWDEEYTLSPSPYSLTIPAGSSSATIGVSAVNDNIGDELDRVVELRITNATHFAWDERPAEVALVNNDPPTVRVLAIDADAAETRSGTTNAAEFWFVRDAGFSQALTVYFSAGGTAVAGDYNAIGTSVTIPVGERAASLQLRPVQDTEVEGAETVVLTLQLNSNYTIDPANNIASATIADDDLPTVQILATDYDARESGLDPGQFQITRTGGTGGSLTVHYQVYGTASPSNFVYLTRSIVKDYEPLSGVATFPAGSSSVNIPVTPVTDSVLETMETVVAVLRGSPDYLIGNSNTATVYIDDSNSAQFAYDWTKMCAAAGYVGYPNSVVVPAEVVVRRFGTSRTAQQLAWALTTTDGVFRMTNTYAYPFTVSGANITFGNGYHTNGWLDFAPYVWEIRPEIHAGVPAHPNGAILTIFEGINQIPFNVLFFGPDHLLSLSVVQRIAIEGGQQAVARVNRPVTGAAFGFFLINSGPALASAGFTNNPRPYYTFPANQTFFDIPLTALNDGFNDGWKPLYVAVDPMQQLAVPDNRATAPPRVELLFRDPTQFTPQPPVDTDEDGLSDDYESVNGLDAQHADDPFVDPDRDGLNHLEEQAAGSRSNITDTDNDGASDLLEFLADWRSATNQTAATPSLDNSVPVRLKTTSCFKCHVTSLHVGDLAVRNSPPGRYTADEVVRLAKGQSYPIRVNAAYDRTGAQTYNFYGAEVLAAASPPGFILEDPANLLGPSKQVPADVATRTARLHVPRIELAVDGDRDGTIRFLPSTNDQTSASRPYTFWVNDDRDSGSDDTAEDLDPTAGPLDNADSFISNLRDLEDFTRLHLKIEAVSLTQLQQGTLSLALEFRDAVNAPGIRIFRSYLTNGTPDYLTNETVAAQQISGGYGSAVGQITSAASFTLPATFWSGATGSNAFRPFLFEATGVGEGQLVAVLKQGTTSIAESTRVHLKLRKIADLFEPLTAGDTIAVDWSQVRPMWTWATNSGCYCGSTLETRDYILFVHGWRMQTWERRAFANTAFKRLYWQNYRGRFGLFSWPTEWIPGWVIPLDPQNYDRSERKAFQSAHALERLLDALNRLYPGKVRVVAHSMGNVVVSEALRQRAKSGSTPTIHTFAASQAASVAHAYDAIGPKTIEFGLTVQTPEVYANYPPTREPYFRQIDRVATRIFNYHNKDDYALGHNLWELNQDTKPDTGWRYATNRWYREETVISGGTTNTLHIRLSFEKDTYEIYAHIAEARSKALGSAVYGVYTVGGPFNGEPVNLNELPFLYRDAPYEHSAQFRSFNMRRHTYWRNLLDSFAVTP